MHRHGSAKGSKPNNIFHEYSENINRAVTELSWATCSESVMAAPDVASVLMWWGGQAKMTKNITPCSFWPPPNTHSKILMGIFNGSAPILNGQLALKYSCVIYRIWNERLVCTNWKSPWLYVMNLNVVIHALTSVRLNPDNRLQTQTQLASL